MVNMGSCHMWNQPLLTDRRTRQTYAGGKNSVSELMADPPNTNVKRK